VFIWGVFSEKVLRDWTIQLFMSRGSSLQLQTWHTVSRFQNWICEHFKSAVELNCMADRLHLQPWEFIQFHHEFCAKPYIFIFFPNAFLLQTKNLSTYPLNRTTNKFSFSPKTLKHHCPGLLYKRKKRKIGKTVNVE
jgi:hypothetical protein